LLQEYETLLIEGSTQGQQIKEAIEQVLGVPALIKGRDELGTLLKAAQKAQQQDLQRTKGSEKLAETQANLITRQDSYERDLQGLVSKLEMVKAERVALDDDIAASQTVHDAKVKLDMLTEQRKGFESTREQKAKDRLDLLASAWRDLVELKVSVRRDQLEARRLELSNQMKGRAIAEHQISQLQELLNTQLCPTCRQDLSQERSAEIGRDLGRLQGELQSLSDTSDLFQELSAQIAALNKIRGSNVRDRLDQINRDLQNIEVQFTRIDNESDTLREEIRGYDTAEIARKRSIRDEKLKEEARLQSDINTRRDEIKKIKEELAVNQRTIEGLSGNRSQRSTIKAQLCSQLEKTFNQSIERLRDRLRQVVENHANQAFHESITQKSYRGLEINKNYGLSIVDDGDRHVPVRSAGAEQIVALSLIDGLNRTADRAPGPVVMDTPFGRLDPSHRDNILAYMPKVTSQFVLLVHRGEIRPDTDLAPIKSRIGAVYQIREINSRHSVLKRTSL
jgi:DNA sulfur modification protein DndD